MRTVKPPDQRNYTPHKAAARAAIIRALSRASRRSERSELSFGQLRWETCNAFIGVSTFILVLKELVADGQLTRREVSGKRRRTFYALMTPEPGARKTTLRTGGPEQPVYSALGEAYHADGTRWSERDLTDG